MPYPVITTKDNVATITGASGLFTKFSLDYNHTTPNAQKIFVKVDDGPEREFIGYFPYTAEELGLGGKLRPERAQSGELPKEFETITVTFKYYVRDGDGSEKLPKPLRVSGPTNSAGNLFVVIGSRNNEDGQSESSIQLEGRVDIDWTP